MLVRFMAEGTAVFKGEADSAPFPGSTVEFRMVAPAAGTEKGKLVEAIVSKDSPLRYDYDTLAPQVIVDVTVYQIREVFE